MITHNGRVLLQGPGGQGYGLRQGDIQGHRPIGRLPRSREADAGIKALQEAHQIYW